MEVTGANTCDILVGPQRDHSIITQPLHGLIYALFMSQCLCGDRWGRQIDRGDELNVVCASDLTGTVVTSRVTEENAGDVKLLFHVDAGNENVVIGDGGVVGRLRNVNLGIVQTHSPH